jgi:hypothetical protein
MPTHDIIDNRIRELAPEINNFLTNSIRAHFAVGYFFLSVFQAIAGYILQEVTLDQVPTSYHPHNPPSALRQALTARLSGCACGWSSAAGAQLWSPERADYELCGLIRRLCW